MRGAKGGPGQNGGGGEKKEKEGKQGHPRPREKEAFGFRWTRVLDSVLCRPVIRLLETPPLLGSQTCPPLQAWRARRNSYVIPGALLCASGFDLAFLSFCFWFLSWARMFSHVLVVVVVVVVLCGHLVVVDPAHELVRWFFIWEGRERERCASDNMPNKNNKKFAHQLNETKSTHVYSGNRRAVGPRDRTDASTSCIRCRRRSCTRTDLYTYVSCALKKMV